MDKYKEFTKNIPWDSAGRETIFSIAGKSIVPVGSLPFQPIKMPEDNIPYIDMNTPGSEDYLMNIVGTAIQVDNGKLITCLHVVKDFIEYQQKAYIWARVIRERTVAYVPYPIHTIIKYVDPRINKVNDSVDLAVLLVPAKSTANVPYEVPNIEWGDSTQIGVGDKVVIAGYPLGKEMFLKTQSNRGIVQPTFYNGIVSAVLPATKANETRLIQVSIPSAGGMSGGALLDASTGKLLGIITSGLNINGIPQPMTYALPAEIIKPFVEVITFKTN